MIWLRILLSRFTALFRKKGLEQRLEEELKSHLEMLAEENLKRGMGAEEAHYAALRSFGGVEQTKESYREQRGLPFIESLAQDIRYTLRTLRRNPGFTVVAVLTLALGIGANTAIFSAVNALLLSPYPFPEPDRIMFVEARHISGKNHNTGYHDFHDWRAQNVVFEDMAIAPETLSFTLTGEGEPQRITGGLTTFSFLHVLGIQPLMGRFFTAEEDRPHASLVAVLTYGAWQRRFAGSPKVLGRTMTLDGMPYAIIGVLPARFAFPGVKTCEFFSSVQESPLNGRTQHQYGVVARLKPGVTVERAQADMTSITRRLAQEYPETNTGWGAVVVPIRQALAGLVKKPVLILAGAVAFVLLLACLNVAALLLARASGRAREVAVRASLGATRGRIVRQTLTESVLLALFGGGLGLILAALADGRPAHRSAGGFCSRCYAAAGPYVARFHTGGLTIDGSLVRIGPGVVRFPNRPQHSAEGRRHCLEREEIWQPVSRWPRRRRDGPFTHTANWRWPTAEKFSRGSSRRNRTPDRTCADLRARPFRFPILHQAAADGVLPATARRVARSAGCRCCCGCRYASHERTWVRWRV
jgi:hypothetical protein